MDYLGLTYIVITRFTMSTLLQTTLNSSYPFFAQSFPACAAIIIV